MSLSSLVIAMVSAVLGAAIAMIEAYLERHRKLDSRQDATVRHIDAQAQEIQAYVDDIASRGRELRHSTDRMRDGTF